ncbi:aldehyde dehydrogenase (NADP(+)) [Caldimonas tepidiphila]|uniref:aldehyde dehydrogenase (NADP(+)) n=1 Tax=Caldimonas tepidiphila TaxID=2315841 RepID=UPI000E5BF78F|nr:aldehyde dehydrogenase (NADP(+)) [Caldimonas tepidiphila]
MFHSIDARTLQPVGEPLAESTPEQIDAAVARAADAFEDWASSRAGARAALLRGLADALEAKRETLVPLADAETALGSARLNGELDRTCFQLRGFAREVEAGAPFRCVDDAAVAGAPPAGRPRLTRVLAPLGPVAMFSASNFPFAFSVLGGDTASALAAGCTVVVKAHPGHPRLSLAGYELAREVIAAQGLDEGVLQMVQGPSIAVGVHLVRHPDIAAVAFTGSLRGGMALQAEINARAKPIPFYGELGSINPVVALPAALAARGEELAKALAASIVQGSGQFCTSPGVLVVRDDAVSDAFVAQLAAALKAQATHPMLTAGMRAAFDAGRERLAGIEGARALLDGHAVEGGPTPALFEVSAGRFLAEAHLREEVFGPLCVVVRAASAEDVIRVLRSVGGSLTVTVWGAENADHETQSVVRAAMAIAGRVLFSGVPTGVAVTHAQHHGGPFPSSTQPQSTSVGYAALDRFLRPVALQDAPAWLLAEQGVAAR